MKNGQENTVKTRFNPLDGRLSKPAESTPSTVEKKFNPLEGTVEEVKIVTEKTEAEIKAEKAEQRRKIAEAEYEKQKEVESLKQKTKDTYPPEHTSDNQKKNKSGFNPLDTIDGKPFSIIDVDQTPKKKSFWKRLFS